MVFFLTETFIFVALLSVMDKNQQQELYRAIKNGDQEAFKKFYDESFEKVYIYLSSRGIRSDVAEDLIQKAFIYIWENRQKINPDLSLHAYLFRIAYSRMINHLNRSKPADYDELKTEPNVETPLDKLQLSDLQESIETAIKKMPERRRSVFEHCFINEFTYKETAEILKISPKTVENHMALALRDLRASLKNFIKI
tara:strand:- start:2794 stop:3384 length:591 start_codon:yes stop_codon:yes gene_type:complete